MSERADGEFPGEGDAAALPARVEPPAPPEPAQLELLRCARPREESSRYEAHTDIPFYSARGDSATPRRRDWRRFRAAASLTAVLAIGAAAAAAHVHELRVAKAETAQARGLAQRLDTMSKRLETVEAARSHDELANLRKVLAEIKSSAASTRDVGGTVGQLAQRIDKLEKEQGPRFDKLGDRINHDTAARLADVAARLDKLEAKTTVAVASAKPAPKVDVAKARVSYEPTGAIARTPPRLRNYYLAEIRNGYAMIDSPAGEFAVAPGDLVPGGGRVLRIERHGRDWVVLTTQGQIVAADD